MIAALLDTGPMLAIVDPTQGDIHLKCVAQLRSIQGDVLTTWPCIAEAMHLGHRISGRSTQNRLWRLLEADGISIAIQDKSHLAMADQLMDRYANVPMDLADASLVIAAESVDCNRIFTLDNDFRIYRFKGSGHFEIIPG